MTINITDNSTSELLRWEDLYAGQAYRSNCGRIVVATDEDSVMILNDGYLAVHGFFTDNATFTKVVLNVTVESV